eukprot:2485386-Pleurochrysis_carterae.AAC.1
MDSQAYPLLSQSTAVCLPRRGIQHKVLKLDTSQCLLQELYNKKKISFTDKVSAGRGVASHACLPRGPAQTRARPEATDKRVNECYL